ncbi:hypothetical protein ABK249_02865 [Neorhizobium sp. Rsf11]|uniref:Uncharacterized protein n=1 Tax=Neorhizobium phenanthreniclasticum TaxID=3157917 RepID=A0ABV0LYP1_9HYPH
MSTVVAFPKAALRAPRHDRFISNTREDVEAAVAADPNEQTPRTLADILQERVGIWNDVIAFWLLAAIIFCLGFFAATVV